MKLKFLDRLFERWRAADLHQVYGFAGSGHGWFTRVFPAGDTYYNTLSRSCWCRLPQFIDRVGPPLGIVGFYGLLIVTFSCYIRKYIGQKGPGGQFISRHSAYSG